MKTSNSLVVNNLIVENISLTGVLDFIRDRSFFYQVGGGGLVGFGVRGHEIKNGYRGGGGIPKI